MSYNYYSSPSLREEDDILETEVKTEEELRYKDCILFAIDCSKSMWEENMEGDIPLVVALKSVRSTLLNKINGRSTDLVGVVLFGTKHSKNSAQKDYIFLMQALDVPDAARINEIDILIENLSILEDKYGSTDEKFSMGDVFWVCSDVISSAPELFTKRIFLITDNDDPTDNNPTFRKTSIQRAKDLSIAGAEISLFGLDRPGVPFDVNIFYRDIASFDESDESSVPSSGAMRLNELLDKVKSTQTKTRSEFRVPFQISADLEIGIRGYNVVIESKLSTARNFTSEGAQVQEVKSLTIWRCEDTQENLTPTNIHLGYEYGGELVTFTKEEVQSIMKVREPSLICLGFKQNKLLKTHHQISHPYFIYPDESQYEGSNATFFTLLDKLAKRNRIAICSFVRRANALPKVVALLPQQEKIDADGNQIDPPGFHMIILPYADEIRPLPSTATSTPVELEAREAANVLSEKLLMQDGYDPLHYENPFIRSQKNMIEKSALESQNVVEKPVDNSIPNYDFIKSNLAEDIEKFKKAVGLDSITVDDLTEYNKPAKRKQEEAGADGSKRAKNNINADSIEELWHAGKLSKATNQYLKDFLTTVGIQPKKLKADLIEQVVEYLKMKHES